ncbi:MAG: CerR family C-terminal domain-containing protein [Lysobacterales bacterium]|jgi:AcrR family transcriptional regulator
MSDANNQTSVGRGDATRETLVAAAIDVFGRDGFNAASTRAISRAAGVNQALIGYHFGGKPGLYLAAIRHIAESLRARLGPLLEVIETELSTGEVGLNPEQKARQALALLHRLTDTFVAVLASEESATWARLILREQQDPSEGFDIFYDEIMHRMLGATARLVKRTHRGATLTDQQAKLTAVTVLGQVIVFRAARAAVLRGMGWDRLQPTQIETIKALLRRNVVAMLETE